MTDIFLSVVILSSLKIVSGEIKKDWAGHKFFDIVFINPERNCSQFLDCFSKRMNNSTI